jgi:mRNA interferase YafQ
MYSIIPTTAFTKDSKKAFKRSKKVSKLKNVIELIASGNELPAKYRNHKLVGNWTPKWECHIEPDWLLIYEVVDGDLILYRTGSHSDLFR